MSGRYRIVVDPAARDGVEFRGGCLEALRCKDQQMVLGGPADCGKTYVLCVKLHLLCSRYGGLQAAMVRKTYASMPGTVCQTFAKVIERTAVQTLGANFPTRYLYPNGSMVWVGGMDKPDKVLGSERHVIYVNQAEELKLDEWETLSTRCTGRAASAKDQSGVEFKAHQMMGDCNPGGSRHWIREQAKDGKLRLFNATRRDNPSVYDEAGNLTEAGARREAALDSLSGLRRLRLRDGVWATAEGAVYDTFSAHVHVRTRDPLEMRRWLMCQDQGYTNPAVVLLIGEDPDGRWHCFKEFFRAGVLEQDVVAEAKRWAADPVKAVTGVSSAGKAPRVEFDAVDDAAPGLIAALQEAGVWAKGADKGLVKEGIYKVQNRLAVRGDGLPRYSVDPGCVNHINEFESYEWEKDRPKDVPKKENDHSMDALRYLEVACGEPTGAFAGAAGIRVPKSQFADGDRLVQERMGAEDFL